MQLLYTVRRTSSWQTASLALFSASLLSSTSAARLDRRQETPERPTFDWGSLEPTTELNWVDCYIAPYQCTRLSVPLNYSSPDDGSGAVAIVRYPSPLADTSSYEGPILFNPGGPGGSGVDTIVAGGPRVQAIFGEEFDIIGFDTRAVGETTPQLTFPGTEEESIEMNRDYPDLTDLSEASWPTLPERMKRLEEYAVLIEKERGDILRHATTDNVARDMLSIVEAYGQEKLRYWGISYGTALGSVFASMFPDKVERMVIDAVLDQEGYYKNNWTLNIADADKTLTWFFDACIEAGPSLCAFHADSSSSIRTRYEAVETLILSGSISTPDGKTFGLSHFQSIVHFMLNDPRRFPVLAQALVDIEQDGDVSVAIEAMGGSGVDSYLAIALRCTDTEETDDEAEELMEYARSVRNASRYMDGAVAGARLACNGWKVNPDNFKGPMGGNTSFPLLFVGNTADPATPLEAAKQTSAKFPGSRVLTYDVPGHGILVVPNNTCIDSHFRNYMLNGTLPEEGTVCEPENEDFFAPVEGGAGNDTGTDDSAEDAESGAVSMKSFLHRLF